MTTESPARPGRIDKGALRRKYAQERDKWPGGRLQGPEVMSGALMYLEELRLAVRHDHDRTP